MNKLTPTTWGIIAVVVIFAVWMITGIVPYALTTILPRWGWNWLPTPDPASGVIGDMFGMANALFSAIAILGVIATLYLQIVELRENRAEYKAMVAAQQVSAETALLAAKFATFQSTVSSMSALLGNEQLSVDDFIAARNKLWFANKVLSRMIHAEKWKDVPIPEIPRFSDDSLILNLEQAIRQLKLIASDDRKPKVNQPETWGEFLRLRNELILILQALLLILDDFLNSNETKYIFLSDLKFHALRLRSAFHVTIIDALPQYDDDQLRNMMQSGSMPNWIDGGDWKNVMSNAREVVKSFRSNSRAWAELASVDNSFIPSPPTPPAAP